MIRTRTLAFHVPLAPGAPLRRIDATNASVDPQRGPIVVPLLSPSGDVDLLVESAAGDVLVAGDGLTSFSAPDGHRVHDYRAGAGFTGLSLPGTGGRRALLLTDARRGLAVEDHGPGPSTLPAFIGLTHGHGARTITLARRDDGALGVLVLDGAAPANAAVAPYDRLAAAVAPPALLAPWSTVVTADDPRCKKHEGQPAYRALVIFDPATWLSLDPTALPGMALGSSGLALVRWGTERVCLEGLDVPMGDPGHVRGGESREWRLVVRWGEGKERGAVLRAADVRQELSCSVRPP